MARRKPTPFWRDAEFCKFLESLPAKQELAVRIAHRPDREDDIAYRKWMAAIDALWRSIGTDTETIAEVSRLVAAAKEAI